MGSLASHSVLLGSSAEIRRVRDLVDAVSATDATVLISGETGTGKELVARMLHERSGRPALKFVPVNCGALSPTVLESELFGHARGAFTGANTARSGLWVTANGGTLFLDEISELALSMQARLLRVLQESEVRAVGADRSRVIDARVIAATNRPLRDLVARGEFRQDLFYRLNVFEITVPPLRDRRPDIEELTEHFVHKYSVHLGRNVPDIAKEVRATLNAYDWPGNVRQLEHVIERALILCQDQIETIHLSLGADRVAHGPRLREAEEPSSRPRLMSLPQEEGPLGPLRLEKENFEKEYLRMLMESSHNNRAEAARVAHLDPSNLRRLLKRHGLL
jgi:transcriptional regulator with PAS, ATPase and Fis domain